MRAEVSEQAGLLLIFTAEQLRESSCVGWFGWAWELHQKSQEMWMLTRRREDTLMHPPSQQLRHCQGPSTAENQQPRLPLLGLAVLTSLIPSFWLTWPTSVLLWRMLWKWAKEKTKRNWLASPVPPGPQEREASQHCRTRGKLFFYFFPGETSLWGVLSEDSAEAERGSDVCTWVGQRWWVCFVCLGWAPMQLPKKIRSLWGCDTGLSVAWSLIVETSGERFLCPGLAWEQKYHPQTVSTLSWVDWWAGHTWMCQSVKTSGSLA